MNPLDEAALVAAQIGQIEAETERTKAETLKVQCDALATLLNAGLPRVMATEAVVGKDLSLMLPAEKAPTGDSSVESTRDGAILDGFTVKGLVHVKHSNVTVNGRAIPFGHGVSCGAEK